MKSALKLVRFWLVLAAALGVLAFFGFCWTHRVRSVGEWQVYQAMEQECHPAWREYHLGRIRAGDSVEEVIDKTQPPKVARKGRWVFLGYDDPDPPGLPFSGFGACAYDGRMVFAEAHSCTWIRVFFDE